MNEHQIKPITILMADDDPDDQLMAREAFEENRMANSLIFVNNGEELMNYFWKPMKTKEGRKGFLHFAECIDNRNLLDLEEEITRHGIFSLDDENFTFKISPRHGASSNL